jgi:DSF synthase
MTKNKLPKYEQLEISEIMDNVYVGEMKINGRKSFNLNFIEDLTDFFMYVYQQKNKNNENRFFVFKGEEGSGIFNLGGDLKLFINLVENKDIQTLQNYGRKCIDLIYKSLNAKEDKMTTVALINGDAKGGGLESALACDIIIAEKGYKIQLPEIKLGFFPGMGAFQLLSKKIGPQKTKEFIINGTELKTEELFKMGVFDFIVEKGESEKKLKEIVKKERNAQETYNSIRKINDMSYPISYEELIKSVDYWTNSLMSLKEKNLRYINKVINKQNKF